MSEQAQPQPGDRVPPLPGFAASASPQHQLLKLALELGPLAVFFIANGAKGIFWATGLFMAATVVSLTASRLLLKKLPVMPLVTGVFILIFGGLTLWLQDELFIKLKPTIVNLLFASGLLGGLLLDQLYVRILFGEVLSLTDLGWRKLQLRWGLFFLFLAGLNEVVWRGAEMLYADIPHVAGQPHPADNLWVGFKFFVVMPLTFLFMLLQISLIKDHSAAADPHAGKAEKPVGDNG